MTCGASGTGATTCGSENAERGGTSGSPEAAGGGSTTGGPEAAVTPGPSGAPPPARGFTQPYLWLAASSHAVSDAVAADSLPASLDWPSGLSSPLVMIAWDPSVRCSLPWSPIGGPQSQVAASRLVKGHLGAVGGQLRLANPSLRPKDRAVVLQG